MGACAYLWVHVHISREAETESDYEISSNKKIKNNHVKQIHQRLRKFSEVKKLVESAGAINAGIR